MSKSSSARAISFYDGPRHLSQRNHSEMSLRVLFFLALTISLWASVGCSPKVPLSPVPESTSERSPLTGTLSSPVFTSPISVPETESKPLLPRDLTPEPGLGTVQGVLYLNGEPATGHILYLAAVIHTEEGGVGGLAALDPIRDPRAESDGSGYFVFLNISPGRYALGINSPVGPVLINRNGREIIAEVQADQITDLAKIQIVPFDQ